MSHPCPTRADPCISPGGSLDIRLDELDMRVKAMASLSTTKKEKASVKALSTMCKWSNSRCKGCTAVDRCVAGIETKGASRR